MTTKNNKIALPPSKVPGLETPPEVASARLKQALDHYRDYVRRYGRTWLDKEKS